MRNIILLLIASLCSGKMLFADISKIKLLRIAVVDDSPSMRSCSF